MAVTDDESLGITLSPTTLTVNEGDTADYTVKLSVQPTADVTVNITGGGDVTVNPTSLTFTSATWNTAQTVTVTAAQDDDGADDALTVGHAIASSSAAEYIGATLDGLPVTVDDDESLGITLSPTTLTVNEGSTADYTVKLSVQPTADVTVNITGGGDVTVNPTSLTFTSVTWDTAQTVTVTAAQDDDGADDTLTVGHAIASSSAAEYVGTSLDGLPVTVDDDESLGITLSPTTLTVNEGSTADYTVKLSVQPTADVTINITGGGDVTVNPTSLTFTSATWNTAQTVTVTAAQDDDGADDTLTVGHAVASSSAPEYVGTTLDGLPVTVDDDESLGITLSPTTLTVNEGSTADYTVKLSVQPTADVTVNITGGGDVTVNPTSLTFTSATWNTAQTVTVTAAQDDDGADDTLTVGHAIASSSAAEYVGTSLDGLPVTVTDDESLGITLSPTTLTVNEGSTADYTVKLSVQPTADVTVNITGGGDVTVNPTSLTFTSATWNTAQTVTVTAAQDDDGADDTLTVGHAIASSSAAEYVGTSLDGLPVTVDDDESLGITLSPTTLMVNEGSTADYTVKLSVQPTADVTINITGGGDVTVNPTSLTFTSATWNTAQTVTVTAAQDDDGADDTLTVGHAVASSSAPEYVGATLDGLPVTVDDDESLGITLSPTTLTVNEGSTADYTVKLSVQPTADVTVNITGGGDVTVNPTSLTFTSVTWDTAQTVTVTAAQDDDGADDTLTVGHAIASSSAAEYVGTSLDGLPVTVTDDESLGITLSPTTLTVNEGSTADYTVKLSVQPTADVTVNITGGGDVTVNPTSLTFTSATWNTAQTVTVTAAQDDDGADDTLTVGHAIASSSAAEYIGATLDGLPVTVDDDESLGITLSPTTLTVNEGSTADYTVKLSVQPTADVTVNITGGGDVTVNPTSLTFTSVTWDTAQTVTVTAAQDDDGADDTLTVGHAVDSSSAAEYVGTSLDGLPVTVDDDESLGLTVSFELGTYTVAEGDTVAVKVQLNADPEREVVVPLTTADQGGATSADYSGVPASLTFQSGDTEKSFTFTAILDTDDDDESVKLGFGALPAGVTAGTTNEATVLITAEAQSSGGICDRSPAIQEAIIFRLGGLDSCSDATLAHIGNIETLHISRELGTLRSGDLVGLSSLKSLTIYGTNLHTIESGAFAPVNHTLTSATFTQNKLEPSDLSELTSGLKGLSLAHNNINSLGASAFSRFTKLEDLGLWGNPITSLDVDAFDGLSSLRSLALGGYNPPDGSGNGRRRLDLSADLFADNGSLQVLDLSNSRISTIPSNTFNNLNNLKRLVLKDNDLTTLTRDMFHAELGNLQSLSLGCNNLTTGSFSSDWSDNLDGLRDLYLHNNYLEAVDTGVVSSRGLPELRFLSLEHNPNLSNFSTSALQGYSHQLYILMFGNEGMVVQFVGGPPAGWPDNVYVDFHSDVRSCGNDSYTVQQPTFRVFDASARESNNGADSTMTFSVNLLYSDRETHSVDYHTQDGTATAGSDYTATSGTLTFRPGEYKKVVVVTVKDDTVPDSGETFQLVLSNPTGGAQLHGTGGRASGTILNHDQQGVEASFPQGPYASTLHTGSSARPQVVVAFSEAVAAFGKYTPSVQVAGGTLDSVDAHAEDGIENAWLFVLAPDGDGDVTFELIPNAACASGGICTAGGTPLIQVPAALTIPGPAETETSEATAEVTARPNTPATGAPTASGTAQAGETLTADTSGITDEDGLTNVSYSYQWVADDTNIDGATNSAYTLTDADEGKTIKVKVSFTDDANNQETLTSAATEAVAAKPNTPATGAPTINGRAQVGETLTANTSSIADADGLTNVSYNYQWIRNDDGADTNIARETASAYTLVTADQGKTIRVEVSFTDDANNEETLTSAATVAVAPQSDNTVADEAVPVWSADMLVVEYSSVSIGAASADLFSNVGGSAGLQVKSLWSYTLGRDLRLAFTDGVPGAEDMTLQVGDLALAFPAGSSGESRFKWNDVDVDWEDGQTISVRIVPTSATATVPPNTPATGLPTISGKAQVEETLTADTSGIADANGLTNVSYSYQWIRSDGNTNADIEDATDSTYEVSNDDLGQNIKVQVSFTDDAGNQESLTSEATVAVAAKPNSPATGAPVITGTAQVDETLTVDLSGIADSDGLTNVSYSYQWIRNDGNADTDIENETGLNYELSDDDVGKTVKVRVSFTDDRNFQETLTSNPTAAVAATPNSPATGLPTISGTAQVDLTLTADTSGISDADGLTNVSYSYQWIRNDGTNDSDIGGQTGSTYTLVSADEGKTIKVRVSFTDDAGNEETLTSAATAAVAAAPSRLTVSLENAATTHDGSAVFTFEIRFSEEFALSYTTLKFHAFDVTGGEVLKAQRMDKPSNIRWLITVGPDVNGDVTVVLPVTEDCAAQGAICTEDGRPLSNRLDMTVTGPLSADQNTEATGAPTISGTAQVGETLTADVSSIADSDGLTNVSYSYQWIRNDGTNDADIGGQTGSTYTLTDEDMGKTIKVRVSFTDDAGNEETLTSAATAAVASRPNTPATGLPTISGTVQVDQTLTADVSSINDADGLTNVSYSYQWIRNDGGTDADIAGETASTHTLVSADEGKTIKVRVSFTDDAGNEETLTSAATAAVASRPNTPATGLPTISGTVQVDETLTADTSGISDADGLTNVSYSYQWIRNDGTNDSDMGGQTGSTYTLVSADEGKAIKVRVSFTDDAGNEETLTSAATAAVASRPNTPATGLPTISGTAQVDETLTADVSSIADSNGLTNVSYSYQWIRNDGTNDADIGGQTGSTYTLTDEDEGMTIKVRVSFTDDAGNEETLTSAATAAVAARPNTPATGLPTISGTAQVGKTLTANISGIADSNGLDNAEFSYQWLANDADIQNATDSTYTLTDDDVGKTIKVRVSFTDDRSNDETLTSAATDTVVAKPDSPDTDAPPRDPGATVDVTVGNTVTGEIEEAIEVDWFKVSLLASETYQIDMRGAWGGEWARIDGEIVWVAPGTLHDPKLLGVFSAANVLVPGTDEEVSGDDRGDYEEGKNSRITSFSPPADGYYYIAAAAEAAWTGTYELTVTVVADE